MGDFMNDNSLLTIAIQIFNRKEYRYIRRCSRNESSNKRNVLKF